MQRGRRANSGLYVVVLDLVRPVRVTRPRASVLPPGRYVYVGSAQRGLDARIAHHLQRRRRGTWHIVQLTTSARVTPVGAVRLTSASSTECDLSCQIQALVRGEAVVPGFGAADCNSGCAAHLWRCAGAPTLAWIAEAIAGYGLTEAIEPTPARRRNEERGFEAHSHEQHRATTASRPQPPRAGAVSRLTSTEPGKSKRGSARLAKGART